MASISLEELIGRLSVFDKTTAAQCAEMMREEAPKGRFGALKASIGVLEQRMGRAIIGTNIAYADWVVNGRGEVKPKDAKVIYFVDYDGDDKSVHHGVPGERVWRRKVGPSKPNDFVSRTERDILAADLDIVKGFTWAKRTASAGVSAVKKLWNR